MASTEQRGGPAHIIDTASGPWVVSDADSVLAAIDPTIPSSRRMELAAQAIAIDSTCPDAFLAAADAAKGRSVKLSLLTKAVRLGTLLWQQHLQANVVTWWEQQGTRPYLQAIFAKAAVLHELGRRQEARLHFELLLAMAPSDPLNVRAYGNDLDVPIELSKRYGHLFPMEDAAPVGHRPN